MNLMGFLTPDERRQLIQLLLELPGIGEPAFQDTLLLDMPPYLRAQIPRSANARTDLYTMVDVLDSWGPGPDGTWPLLLLIENASDIARASRVSFQLQDLLLKLRVRATQTANQTRFQTLLTAYEQRDWDAVLTLAKELPADYPGLAPLLERAQAALAGARSS